MRVMLKVLVGLTLGLSGLYAQTCPSGCSTITSGSLTFCKCNIYTTPEPSDRVQMVTDQYITVVDVDGDGLRDIPFGVWYYGRAGTYVLRQTSGGIPGTFVEVQISDTPGYGIASLGDRNGDGLVDFVISTHGVLHKVYTLMSPGSLGPYTVTPIYTGSHPNSVTVSPTGIYFTDYDGSINYYDFSTTTITRRDDDLCGDGVAFGDFNDDGYTDAVCSNYGGVFSLPVGLHVYWYNGSGFTGYTTLDNARKWQGIVAYDMDGDGRKDVIGTGEDVSVFYNDGSSWTEVRLNSTTVSVGVGSLPLVRVNLADLDCDEDPDIVVATACPPSGGATLMWYENLGGRAWEEHPIDFGGNSCSSDYPYPYGVRVGLLDETTDTGRADIVIVYGASNSIYAYYNVTPSISCSPLAYEGDLAVSELDDGERLNVVPVPKGIRITARRASKVAVFRADGSSLFQGTVEGTEYLRLPPGAYFVKAEGRTYRVVVR